MWICAIVHGNYLHTTYTKMVTNKGWYLTSKYASEFIGSLVHKKLQVLCDKFIKLKVTTPILTWIKLNWYNFPNLDRETILKYHRLSKRIDLKCNDWNVS